MMRQIFLLLLPVLIFSGTSFAQDKPNIIIILADDLGYGDLGFNGQDKIRTPVLDNMATEGIVFTRHYAGSTVCGPSRTCLMTGLHSGHSPIRENPRWTKSGKPASLDVNQVTVAKELKKAGYATGIVGKWGLAENLDAGLPGKQGFDYFYGFNTHRAAHHYYPEEIWENDELIKLKGNVMMDKVGQYSQDLFTEKALDFIDKNHETPFFLYLAFTIPHYELTIPEEQKADYYKEDWPLREMKMGHYRNDKNGHVTYAAMVSRMDRDIGLVLEKLNSLGINDNTLVIFTSDNGHEYDNVKEEFFNSNGDFRGKKRDLYDGGVHVPFVAVWPENISPGTTSDHVSAFWDFLPTVCEIAQINPSAEVDGISYFPSLVGMSQKKHEYLYWEFNEGKGPIQAVLKYDWKLVRFVGAHSELFNLKNDPGEQKDLHLENPTMALQLEDIMDNARTDHPEFPLVKMK